METVCLLTAGGVEKARIAEILGCHPYRVGAVLKKRANKDRVAQLKGEMLKHEVEQHFGLMRMLPKSREVIGRALDGSEKVRVETAKWLHESVIAKPAQKQELRIQGRVEHDLKPLIEQMGKQIEVFRERAQNSKALERVKIGTAALVRQLPSGEE